MLPCPVLQDGLGQKYGAPRRNAQERIRSEVARSEVAAAKIDELLELLGLLCKRALDAELGAAEAAREKVGKQKRARAHAHETKTLESESCVCERYLVGCVSPDIIISFQLMRSWSVFQSPALINRHACMRANLGTTRAEGP